ncbi:cytochrome P450 [Ktedonospora formicarum]|uniref:cytochrome P450 n=1 Tax=Ktedonospora formicarum TaxID=2778364 RepID=UPI001C6920C1|nr:cytochrome P450 [Ktedonospora formicarum]
MRRKTDVSCYAYVAASNAAQTLAPGPLWPTAIWNTVRFARQTLSFVQELRERYGDVVTLPTVLGPWTLVFHPDGVRHVVQENHFNYHKGGISNQVLKLTLGNGLLTNNGDSWLTQRRLIQPAFHRSRIAGFGQLMTESVASWIEEVNIDSREPLDLFQQMSGLTLTIVCKALFGADMLLYKQHVFQALSTAIRLEAQSFYVPGLLSLPTPSAVTCMRRETPSTPSLTS